jgi:RHS repeat-associated protein
MESSVMLWNAQDRAWRPVAGDEVLPAGAILWLHAISNGIVAVTGAYADPTNQTVAAGGAFVPGAGLEACNVRSLIGGQASTPAWLFNGTRQAWQSRVPFLPGLERLLPELLPPGSAFFASPVAPTELVMSDAALRIRYYHQDHLGSSSIITDATGAVVEETAFYPFGAPRVEYRLRGVEEPYKFAQKERDRETGLQYFSRRYLSGTLSRFLSVDPKYSAPGFLSPEELSAFLSEPQDINLYAFARNNPLRYADPTGLGPLDFIEDNLWIPFYHDLDELDVGKTVRVSIAAVEVVGGAVACLETAGAGCAVAANGLDDLVAEYRDGRTLKATAVTYVTGSETAGDVADVGISIFLGGAQGWSKANRAQKLGKEGDKALGVVVGGTVSSNVEMVKGISKVAGRDEPAPNSTVSSSLSTTSSASSTSEPAASSFGDEEAGVCYAEEPVCYGDTEE